MALLREFITSHKLGYTLILTSLDAANQDDAQLLYVSRVTCTTAITFAYSTLTSRLHVLSLPNLLPHFCAGSGSRTEFGARRQLTMTMTTR